jgi:hypothetical protein
VRINVLKSNNFHSFMFIIIILCLSFVISSCTSTPHQLSTSVVPIGGGNISPSAGPFEGTVTLIATPAKYYKFEGWAGAASGDVNPLALKMDSDKNVVAQFRKKTGNLKVQISPADGGTVQPAEGSFEQGIPVKLTATPAKGYLFGSWSSELNGNSNPANILIESDYINVTANFIKQYTLKISSEPFGSGIITPGAGLYDAGSKINLNAVPNFPYFPKMWVGTDANTNPTTVTMSSDKSINVIFEMNVKSPSQTALGEVSKDALGRWGPVASVPIQLNQYEWVEGEIIWQTPNTPNTPVAAYIQEPSGGIVKDFGSSKQANFQFMAQNTGRYTIVFQNNSIWYADYHLTYAVLAKP